MVTKKIEEFMKADSIWEATAALVGNESATSDKEVAVLLLSDFIRELHQTMMEELDRLGEKDEADQRFNTSHNDDW